MDKLKTYFAAGGAVVLVACWPLVVGQIGQRVAEDHLSKMHDNSYEVELKKYERGYLSSDAEFRVTVTAPEARAWLNANQLPVDYTFNSHFTHGLVSINGVTTSANKNFPIAINSKTQLNGNTLLTANTDDITFANEHSLWRSHISPMTINADVTVSGKVIYKVTTSGFDSVSADGYRFALTNFSGEGEGKQFKHFWLGKNKLQVEKAIFSPADQQDEIQFHNMTYSLESDAKNARFSSRHQLQIGELANKTDHLKHGEVDIKIGDLDADLLDQLATYSKSLSSGNVDIEAVRADMVGVLNRLIAKGLYIDVNKLGFSYKDGKTENQFKLSVPPSNEQSKTDISTVIQSVEGRAHSTFDKSFVVNFPNLQAALDELVVIEMASDTEKNYELKAEIKDGNVLFPNGKKMPIISILFPLFVH